MSNALSVKRRRVRVGERCRAYVQACFQDDDLDIRNAGPTPPLLQGEDADHRRLICAGRGAHELAFATEDELQILETVLNDIWNRDTWERRLAPFVDRFRLNADEAMSAFRLLVREGCQPDQLAESLYRAVVSKVRRTAAVQETELLAKKLHARLIEDATMAREFVIRVDAHGLCTFARSDLPEILHGLAETVSVDGGWVVSPADLRNGRLLDALSHVKKVTGASHLVDTVLILNALRAGVSREPIDMDTLVTYAKRARRSRARHRATLEVYLGDASQREVGGVTGGVVKSFERGRWRIRADGDNER